MNEIQGGAEEQENDIHPIWLRYMELANEIGDVHYLFGVEADLKENGGSSEELVEINGAIHDAYFEISKKTHELIGQSILTDDTISQEARRQVIGGLTENGPHISFPDELRNQLAFSIMQTLAHQLGFKVKDEKRDTIPVVFTRVAERFDVY